MMTVLTPLGYATVRPHVMFKGESETT